MLVRVVVILAALALGYLLVKAYLPSLFKPKIEPFVQKVSDPPAASKLNTAAAPVPAPATPVTQPPLQEERTVSPGGPNPPNAHSDEPATISPDAQPIDPYDDNNMSAPIKDSLRNPERSFGPGLDNTGVNRAASSGVANAKALTSESPFSPDFAQNGGVFMGAVSANDLSPGDTYATA